MRVRWIGIALPFLLILQLAAGIWILQRAGNREPETAAINELAHICGENWPALEEGRIDPPTDSGIMFSVLGEGGELLYRSGEDTASALYEAIGRGDVIVDIMTDGEPKGKLLVRNGRAEALKAAGAQLGVLLAAGTLLAAGLAAAYTFYLNRTVIAPFRRLREFAVRVAGGNLELPLDMDRKNIFGPFTESFDIMREELKRAREREQAADKSKKELVAQLSHDIKTPIASIKAIAEVMSLREREEKERQQLSLIAAKADQVDALISNLFHGTLEELEELQVSPKLQDSRQLGELIAAADYDERALVGSIPSCLAAFDALRLQQVFDNLFANSYKYAGTPIDVAFAVENGRLCVRIRDYGPGVPREELPLLAGKYYRGSNSAGRSGAGLGLYISRYLLERMGGELVCDSQEPGFCAEVRLAM